MATAARWKQLAGHCVAMRGSEYERKWGNVDTFLVCRKMFFVIIRDERELAVECWFKAGSERFLELTDLPGFRPAPYLGRRQWVATRTPQSLSSMIWRGLIEHSYRQVTSGLPLYRQRELGVLAAPDRREC